MTARLRARLGASLWILPLGLLALGVAGYAQRYWLFDPAVAPEPLRPNMEAALGFFVAHALLGSVALAVGVFQFLPLTRRGPWHRWAGRAYVASALPAAVLGFVIAVGTVGGPLAATGFALLAILWFGSTVAGYAAARRRDFLAHRVWMIRSYALTLTAVTLRLILAGIPLFGFDQLYVVDAWASWLINLAIAEWLIRRTGRAPSPRPAPSRPSIQPG